MRNRVTWLEMAALICIVIAACILCGIWFHDYRSNNKPKREENADYFSSVYQEKLSDNLTSEGDSGSSPSSADDVLIDSSRESAYQKLKNGERINVLVLGDETVSGYGSENGESWLTTLSDEIYSKYGANAYITNLSYNYATTLLQYYEVKALNNNVDYDLIMISVGANDVRTDYDTSFDAYYEALVRAAKSKYPNAELLTVLQSTESSISKKAEAIKAISEHYNADCIDTITAFSLSSSQELTFDGVFPNDEGYLLYVSETMKVIEENIEAQKKTTEYPEVLFEDAAAFDSYMFVSFSSMSETAPGVYQTSVKKDFDTLSLVYTLSNPGGVYRLYVNDLEYEYRNTKWTGNSDRKQISVFDNGFAGTTKIRIEIEDTANKPKISGLILSGIAQ